MKLEDEIRALRITKHKGRDTASFREDAKALVMGEPLAYIVGYADVLGIRVDMSCRPMIPRPETLEWVSRVLSNCPKGSHYEILDTCSGSGAIAALSLSRLHSSNVTALEIDQSVHIGIIKTLSSIGQGDFSVVGGDIFPADQSHKFDLIFAVPPYVNIEVEKTIDAYESPKLHYFFDKDNGLDIAKRFCDGLSSRLKHFGVAYMELDNHQIPEMQEYAKTKDLSVSVLEDVYGNDAVLVLSLNT